MVKNASGNDAWNDDDDDRVIEGRPLPESFPTNEQDGLVPLLGAIPGSTQQGDAAGWERQRARERPAGTGGARQQGDGR
jgi:hypothetical protein